MLSLTTSAESWHLPAPAVGGLGSASGAGRRGLIGDPIRQRAVAAGGPVAVLAVQLRLQPAEPLAGGVDALRVADQAPARVRHQTWAAQGEGLHI